MAATWRRNWPAKLLVFAGLVLVLRGFLWRLVHPLAAAVGVEVEPGAILAAEIILLAAYTLGLFAFPGPFWRRTVKFVCLMGAYMLVGPVLALGLSMLGMAGSPGQVAAAQMLGHVLALALGFAIYKLAWPHLAPRMPRFNPAA